MIEIRGAYLAAQQFQVFTFWPFLRRTLRLTITHFFVFNPAKVFTSGEARLTEIKLASVEQQHLAAKYGFTGLALLVAGFLLQAVAVLLQLVDLCTQNRLSSQPQ